MDLCNKGNAPPGPFDRVEPNVMELLCSVMMNIEVANLRVKAGRGFCDVPEGVGAVPRRKAR